MQTEAAGYVPGWWPSDVITKEFLESIDAQLAPLTHANAVSTPSLVEMIKERKVIRTGEGTALWFQAYNVHMRSITTPREKGIPIDLSNRTGEEQQLIKEVAKNDLPDECADHHGHVAKHRSLALYVFANQKKGRVLIGLILGRIVEAAMAQRGQGAVSATTAH